MFAKRHLLFLAFLAVTMMPGANCRNLGDGGSGVVVPGAVTLTSILPNTAVPGAPATAITLTGTNFTTNSIASWNGAALATTFVSTTTLTATVPVADLTTAGAFSVTVTDSGVVTAAVTFTVANAGPTIALPAVGDFRRDFFDQVNISRIALGQPAFIWDPNLAQVAQDYALAMVTDAFTNKLADPVTGFTMPTDYVNLYSKVVSATNGQQSLGNGGIVSNGAAFATSLGNGNAMYNAAYLRIGIGYDPTGNAGSVALIYTN